MPSKQLDWTAYSSASFMLHTIQRYGVTTVHKLFPLAARSILGTITHVVTREPLVGLTFDDGPDPEYTPRLLDVLERYGARATFFMTGEAAKDHPELVRRIAHAGHVIGNHSWNHPSFPLISRHERQNQIRACASVIAPYGQRLFRPPYTDQNIASRIDAFLLGYRVVAFNVCTDDWCSDDSAVIAGQLEERVRAGSIVALHDRLANSDKQNLFNRQPMIDGLQAFLSSKGSQFRFLTVAELLRRGRPKQEIWYKEPNVEFLNTLRRADGVARNYVRQPRSKWVDSLVHMFVAPQT